MTQANAKNSQSKSTSSKRSTSSRSASAKGGKRIKVQPAKQVEESRFFDDSIKREIIGVLVIICSLLLLVCSVAPGGGVLTSFLSHWMHLSLGIGSFILPLFLILVGVSSFLPQAQRRLPVRILLGLLLVFLGIMMFLALLTPSISPQQAQLLFSEDQLQVRGGLIGSALAWVFLKLLGIIGARIVAVGLVLAGFIVVGFTVSRALDWIAEQKMRRSERLSEANAYTPEYSADSATSELEPKSKASSMFRSAASGIISKYKAAGEESYFAEDSLEEDSRPTAALFSADVPEEESKPTVAIDPHPAAGRITLAPDTARTRNLRAKGETQALTRKLGSAAKEEASQKPEASKTSASPVVPQRDDGFMLPDSKLLKISKSKSASGASESELQQTALHLQETLEDFGIMASVVDWVAGPTVTLFKVSLPAGVRVSRIMALNDDLALALAAPGVRIFAPVPGTHYVGIEVPNITRKGVLLGDILKNAPSGPLQIAIGMDVEGNCILSDLAKMPHLLIGGTTGSGKSVSINSMIMSILMRATPSEVRFIMIDPKRVEFTPYNGIPHLYVPVVTEAREAASALSWGVAEMERRLKLFSKVGARNIGQFNAKVQAGELEDDTQEEIPYIVIVIDELADLMMNVGKEVEYSISRIAQLARAAGIHLIVATQRPSTNVVTGLIKANITNRIALNVASSIDSRVILDVTGAESLIGNGDLLLSKPEYAKPLRIQGCYVSDEEINQVVEHLKTQAEPDYHSEILSTNLISVGGNSAESVSGSAGDDDPLLWEAADIVVSGGMGSTSTIQRRLKVGYSRAGRIMDMLEEKGVVGPPNGSKPREVLVDAMELEALKAFETHDAMEAKE